jgi:MFS family permease
VKKRSEVSSKTAPRFSYGYVMVAIGFSIMFLSWGLYTVFGVFFDPLLEEFGWSRAVLSGAYALSSILSGVLGIAMGGLTDKYGPRLVVTFSGFFFGLGHILMSQVHTVWQLYLFYGVIVGIGMSGLWVPLVSPLVRWFSGRRSLMTGTVISGLTVGQLIGPVVISRLIAAYEWRMSYIILGGAAMLITVVLAQFMKSHPSQTGRSDNQETEGEKADSPTEIPDLSLKEAAHTKQFWLVALIFFCVGYSAFSITVHVVPNAIKLGIPAVTAANILAISGGIGIIGNFALGGLVGDLIGNRKSFIIGIALMAAALFWLAPAKEIWMFYLFAFVFGIGLGDAGTSESPLLARLFGPSSHGLIYSVLGLGWTIGGAVGPVVTGYLCDVMGDYQMAFLLCGIIGVIGLILLVILKPTKKRGIGI